MKKERKLNISEQKLEAYITAFAIFCAVIVVFAAEIAVLELLEMLR